MLCLTKDMNDICLKKLRIIKKKDITLLQH